MPQKSWFQDILIPTGDQQTYSELQNELDRRESMQRESERRERLAVTLLAVTQSGAVAFHRALGRQGRAPRTEVC
jgi:hypothetical protein